MPAKDVPKTTENTWRLIVFFIKKGQQNCFSHKPMPSTWRTPCLHTLSHQYWTQATYDSLESNLRHRSTLDSDNRCQPSRTCDDVQGLDSNTYCQSTSPPHPNLPIVTTRRDYVRLGSWATTPCWSRSRPACPQTKREGRRRHNAPEVQLRHLRAGITAPHKQNTKLFL